MEKDALNLVKNELNFESKSLLLSFFLSLLFSFLSLETTDHFVVLTLGQSNKNEQKLEIFKLIIIMMISSLKEWFSLSVTSCNEIHILLQDPHHMYYFITLLVAILSNS